ncbi:MAG: hypothetical protein FJ286_15685 [Planctomycetes bacterium]|nr:hypothetical protein [Planctomycetota bacterium]
MSQTANIPPISTATNMPPPPNVADLDIYYENGKGFVVGRGSDYVSLTISDLKIHLRTLGFSGARTLPISALDRAVHDIQFNKCVAYVGPLAGKKAGLHTICGRQILVTGTPAVITPDPARAWPLIDELVQEMLGGEGGSQLPYFFGWLKHAYSTLAAGTPSQGQALALAGPRDCGKSLWQQIIRELLGGREANPYAYMTGRTDFNRDLFGAEVLSFGDEVASTDYRNRVKFGGMIKQFVVNTTQRCHGKGREAVVLDPFWRVIMSLNDEVASLEVLPPLSQDSLIDKVMLLKTRRPALFDKSDWRSRSRAENWARIIGELPGFIAFLEQYQVPHDIRETRLGVKAFQHPDLMVVIGAESPERRLLELIDSGKLYWAPGDKTIVYPNDECERITEREPWSGTAAQLEARLQDTDSTRYSANKLLYYQTACGQYLSALARQYPHRVKQLPLRDGLNRYQLMPPNSITEQQ